ncbi:hypothetical protein EV701_101394 [Chthoniobacter flavus]|uniref:hypothetical protein n=1 Tax=Chthoniobacter flavus TaxID=191863 RepID=UPI0010526853|nr:hypothetical protein [Chthoniobacter flavus]TCO95704.1 hypothetical protein EV701_101394 [Chthoniobacter flavus]
MHPQKLYEFRAWLNVVGGIVITILWVLSGRDHNIASVEWCAGRVIGKHRSENYSSNPSLFSPRSFTYYIDVDVHGRAGSVRVNEYDYEDWSTGLACEVAFRHGRLSDYNFDDIRLPPGGRVLPSQ